MHVPKCAGISIRVALEAALPADTVAPKRQDTTLLCGFTDVDRLAPAVRAELAVGPEEIMSLAAYGVVIGHFSLATLLQLAEPAAIATVLREPRARLLSHYAYWRLSPAARTNWSGFPPLDQALRPLDEFLAEPSVAQVTDNIVCRMLLGDDPRIRPQGFIAATDAAALAADATVVLDQLAFVGVVELPEEMWSGLSKFFGVRLLPQRQNVTSSLSERSDVAAADLTFTERTGALMEARTQVDRLIYRHVLNAAGRSDEQAKPLAAAAYASELLSFGNTAGPFAAEARERGRIVAELSARLTEEQACHAATQMQLQRQLGRLEEVRRSTSWRVTAPARAAGQTLRRLRVRSGR